MTAIASLPITSIAIIKGVKITCVPIEMFRSYEKEFVYRFGRSVNKVAEKRGLTASEAVSILYTLPNRDKQVENAERLLITAVDAYHNHSPYGYQPFDFGAGDEQVFAALRAEAAALPSKPELFTSAELEDAIDQPGFAWENMSNAEQSLLHRSLDAFLHEVMQKKIVTLFDSIKHGDEDHQVWLEKAIRCHFAGLPLPEYVAGKPKQDVPYRHHPDEPFFVLLGRDPQAPELIERWAHFRNLCAPNHPKVVEAKNIANRMRAYKKVNPDIGMPMETYRMGLYRKSQM